MERMGADFDIDKEYRNLLEIAITETIIDNSYIFEVISLKSIDTL